MNAARSGTANNENGRAESMRLRAGVDAMLLWKRRA
jgi:hypothetical protein